MPVEHARGAQIMRSQLGQVRGLGAAKSGGATWWAERISAIALIPLSFWFVISVFRLLGASRSDVKTWLGGPGVAMMMIALIIVTFWHLALGVQVVLEDYVHNESAKTASILAVKFVSLLLAIVAVLSVVKLHVGM